VSTQDQTTVTWLSRNAIPVHEFGEWIFGDKSEFSKGIGNAPPMLAVKGFVRIGFTARKSELLPGCTLVVNGKTYEATEVSCHDFKDHTLTTKCSVNGWILHKQNSAKS
jgi:hypothetical protein